MSEAATAATEVTTGTIEAFVIAQISAMGVDADAIKPEATLIAMGLDSLDVVELSQSVKKRLRIQITPRDFEHATTLSEAVAVIVERADVS
jgi:acyl carrier protein